MTAKTKIKKTNLNEIICRKTNNSQMIWSLNSEKYVECVGQFINRPYDMANYFHLFINKVDS